MNLLLLLLEANLEALFLWSWRDLSMMSTQLSSHPWIFFPSDSTWALGAKSYREYFFKQMIENVRKRGLNWKDLASGCITQTKHLHTLLSSDEQYNIPGVPNLHFLQICFSVTWLFPKLKLILKGMRFMNTMKIQHTSHTVLSRTTQENIKCTSWGGRSRFITSWSLENILRAFLQ